MGESNPRPLVYETIALPAELKRLLWSERENPDWAIMSGTVKPLGALPFIVADRARGGYAVTPEAEAFLNGLEGKLIAPVAIVGKYRTGKSYLVNQLLLHGESETAERPSGFAVGGTVNACTKGIWIWPKTLKAPDESSSCEILVIDTEGIGGVGEGQNHDARIFLFAMLLSSVFVYNCLGTIDENELQSVSLVTNMAREVRRGEDAELDEVAIAEAFPVFVWLLRDFSLQLIDGHQRPLSPGEYLEAALAPLKGHSDSVESKNRVRRQFKHFFPIRDCLTLVRPVEREADLQRLEQLAPTDLRPEFLRNLDRVRRAILGRARRKTVQGTPLDGPRLVSLARVYVEAVNNGRAPNLDLAWNYLSAGENRRLAATLTQKYLSAPTQKDQLTGTIEQARKEFRKERMGSVADAASEESRFIDELTQRLTERIDREEKELKHAVKERAREELDALRQRLIAEKTGLDRLGLVVEESLGRALEHFDSGSDTVVRLLRRFFQSRRAELEVLVMRRTEAESRQRLEALDVQFKTTKEIQNSREAALTQQLEELRESNQELQSQLKETESVLKHKEEVFLVSQETVRRLEALLSQKAARERQQDFEEEQRKQELLEAAKAEAQALRGRIQAAEADRHRETALAAQRESRFNAELEELRAERARNDAEIDTLRAQIAALKVQTDRQNADAARFVEQRARLLSLEEKLADFEDLKLNYEKVIKALSDEKTGLERRLEALHIAHEEQRVQSLNLLDAIGAKIESISSAQIVEKPPAQLQRKYQAAKRAINNSATVQCANCGKFVGSANFNDHLDRCIGPQEAAEPVQTSLTITLGQTLVREEQKPEGKKSYTEYIMHIESEERSWYVSRRFREFCELLSDLEAAMPHLVFPSSCSELWAFLNDIWGLLGGKSIPVEDRRKMLQNIMRDLTRIEVITSHSVFRRFIGDVGRDCATEKPNALPRKTRSGNKN